MSNNVRTEFNVTFNIRRRKKKQKRKTQTHSHVWLLVTPSPLFIVDWRAPLPPAGGQLWVPSASGTSVSVEPLIIYKWVFRERGQTICLLVMSHFTSMEVEGTGYEPGVAGHEWAGGGRQAAGCRPKYEDVFSRVFTDSRAARTPVLWQYHRPPDRRKRDGFFGRLTFLTPI